jgi:hypothetical protein
MQNNFSSFDRKKYLGQQRKLFIECFPENINTPVESVDHYNWKFHSVPNEIKSFEYSAIEDDEIIGYYAAIPYMYSIMGTHQTAGMVCDVMTGVKARGKGIFTGLGKYALNQFHTNGIDFTTGYPIRPEVIPGHKKVGWEFPFELPMYGKFLSLKSFLIERKLSMFTFVLNPLLKTLNYLISILRKKQNEIGVETFNQKELDSISGLKEFFTKIKKEIPIYLLKENSFLKWRLGAPEKDYSIVVLRKNNEIIAFSIARFIVKENVPCYGILDFVLLEEFNIYSSILMRENEKIAKKGNAELLLTMIGEKWAKKYKFLRNGYFKTPFKFSFIINKLNQSLRSEDLYNVNNWHLMWIDSDDL